MAGEAARSEVAEIRRGVTRLSRRMRSERPIGALSGGKISVLSYLSREGPSTPTEVALAEHQQPQSLTRVFAELQLTGLIVRSRDETDGRRHILGVTAAGIKALKTDMALRDRWLKDALGEATDTERQLLVLAAGIMNRLAELSDARQHVEYQHG